MPKSLVLGNGRMLIGLDAYGQVDDFYYDYVGEDDHMGENGVNRIGIWVDGEFSWFSSGEWEIKIDYLKETLGSEIVAENRRLELAVQLNDVVYNEKNIFVRRIEVANKANRKRTVKVFLGHEFKLYGIPKGDTVYYDPDDDAIIHYKGRRVILISGAFSDWTVGLSGIEGKVGTWKDAEDDGNLSKNPIEHGTVDSTIGHVATPDAGESFVFYSWITIAKTFATARKLHQYVIEKTPEHLIESTQDFWREWVNKSKFDFAGLDPRLVDLFKKSLLIIRTHMDNHGGIVASTDSDLLQYGRDKYNYVWPRDGAFVARAMDTAGYSEATHHFFQFCNDVINTRGYLLHKFRNDRSLGSSWHPWVVNGEKRLPIQEDETALVLWSLWHHYECSKDLEFVENIYNSFIKKAGEFLVNYRGSEGLPKPSYDLWEMKYGISSFTVGTVYGALVAAASFSKMLGKEDDEKVFSEAAESTKAAFLKYMFNEKLGYFYKLVEIKDGKILHDETVDASSFYGAYRFGLLAPGDTKLAKALKVLEERLTCKTNIGGVARFEGDQYYRSSSDVPGNPWVITSLWLAQYYIETASSKKELDKATHWLTWVADRAKMSGILSEQFDPHTGAQISAAPLTWSHAEYVSTVMCYLRTVKELGE